MSEQGDVTKLLARYELVRRRTSPTTVADERACFPRRPCHTRARGSAKSWQPRAAKLIVPCGGEFFGDGTAAACVTMRSAVCGQQATPAGRWSQNAAPGQHVAVARSGGVSHHGSRSSAARAAASCGAAGDIQQTSVCSFVGSTATAGGETPASGGETSSAASRANVPSHCCAAARCCVAEPVGNKKYLFRRRCCLARHAAHSLARVPVRSRCRRGVSIPALPLPRDSPRQIRYRAQLYRLVHRRRRAQSVIQSGSRRSSTKPSADARIMPPSMSGRHVHCHDAPAAIATSRRSTIGWSTCSKQDTSGLRVHRALRPGRRGLRRQCGQVGFDGPHAIDYDAHVIAR